MNIFNLIKKDMTVVFSNKSMYMILLLFVPFLVLVLGAEDMNGIYLFSILTFTYMVLYIPFSYEVRDKPNVLIQSLPVKKRDIVISKYISMIISLIMGNIYTFIYLLLIKTLGILDEITIDISIIAFAFVITVFATSILLPAQFKFTSKIANFINMFIYIFFMINAGVLNELYTNLDLSKTSSILLALSIVAVIYFISLGISIALYKSRKFY